MRALILFATLTIPLAAFTQQPPASIDLPPGTHELLLQAKGDGVQIYTCTAGAWTFTAPEAITAKRSSAQACSSAAVLV